MKPSRNLIIILASAVILLSAWVYYLSQAKTTMVDYQREFQAVSKQSSSDDTKEIKSDLDDTNFDDLDTEVSGIEAELNATGEAETQ